MPDSSTATAANPRWENQAPIIAHDPPRWLVRALGWLLIALFTVAVLAAIFVHVPETVQSRFELVTEGGADPIQSPRAAVLEHVLVRPGQAVKKGDRLFVMHVDQVREWRTEIDTRGEALRAMRERSGKFDEEHASAIRIKDSEIEEAKREIAFRQQHLAAMSDVVSRVEKLAANGLISQIELSSHRIALAQSEKDLEQSKRMLAQRQIERQNLDTANSRQHIDEKSAEEDLAIRIAALQQPLSTSANGLLEIRAPYDAICVTVTQQNAGDVVSPGEELCQLAPVTRALQARLDLPEAGLSELKTGQRVRFLFDAFPYQRFGVVNGAIDWISPAAITRQQRSEFLAVASLDHHEIVSGANKYPLKSGMRGMARITVGRRALIEYAFEPLRQLHENMKP